MSVKASFDTLIARIQPLDSEIRALEGHFATIHTRLNSTFQVSQSIKVGSYMRGTMIRGRSDGDLFVVLKRDEVRWGNGYISSSTMLDKFRKDLAERFWQSTVRKDVHSIVVEFSDAQVDVVPAWYGEADKDGWPLYYIPDGSGNWQLTSPAKHNQYLKEADKKSGGQQKSIAQLMKFWRECRTPRVPISSFHIELRLASEGIGVGAVSYASAMRRTLRALVDRECRGIQDPLGISGIIPCVKTVTQRDAALTTVRASRDKANTAETFESWNVAEAKRYWDMVFNGNFPY